MGQNFIRSVLSNADFIEVFNNFVLLKQSNFVAQNIAAFIRRAKQETKTWDKSSKEVFLGWSILFC